jgi:LysM repeat protein
MTWQDSEEEIEIDSTEEKAFREEDYSPLGPKKGTVGKFFQMPDWPFRWVAVGLVAVLVLVVWVFSGSDSAVPEKKLRGLEIQISQLEKRLTALEAQTGQRGNSEDSKISQYMGRFDRFEAATNKRMENLSKRVDSLGQKKPAAVQPVSKPATKDAPAPVAKPQYHLVSKGETLYSISRAYGLTLNELRRLNKLDEKAAIYPGQKLKIK